MDDLTAMLIEARLVPHDDAPRLVLADWLEEHGDRHERALADYVRVQCQLARSPSWAPGRGDLEWVQRQLWWDHVEQWLGPLYDACTQFEFRRGLASVELVGDRLKGWDLAELFAAPGWRWVEEVRFQGPTSAQLNKLLASTAMAGLCRLGVRECKGEWRPGAGGPAFGEMSLLRELRLAGSRLGDRGVERLAEWPLTGIEVLSLLANQITGDGLSAVR